MLNIVIRCGDYVDCFLIPETYNKKQFDALVNMPGLLIEYHMTLWLQWVKSFGGEYLGPRTLDEFHKLDGRGANIKVDGDRVYEFNSPPEKTIFYANGGWVEVLNFDKKKLPWLDWLMSEPGVALGRRWDNFQKATGAESYRKSTIYARPTTYVFQDVVPVGFILSPGLGFGPSEGRRS